MIMKSQIISLLEIPGAVSIAFTVIKVLLIRILTHANLENETYNAISVQCCYKRSKILIGIFVWKNTFLSPVRSFTLTSSFFYVFFFVQLSDTKEVIFVKSFVDFKRSHTAFGCS